MYTQDGVLQMRTWKNSIKTTYIPETFEIYYMVDINYFPLKGFKFTNLLQQFFPPLV